MQKLEKFSAATARQAVLRLRHPISVTEWCDVLDTLTRTVEAERKTGTKELDYHHYRIFWVSAGYSVQYANYRWLRAKRGMDPDAKPTVIGKKTYLIMEKMASNNVRKKVTRKLSNDPKTLTVPNALDVVLGNDPLSLPAGTSASLGLSEQVAEEAEPCEEVEDDDEECPEPDDMDIDVDAAPPDVDGEPLDAEEGGEEEQAAFFDPDNEVDPEESEFSRGLFHARV